VLAGWSYDPGSGERGAGAPRVYVERFALFEWDSGGSRPPLAKGVGVSHTVSHRAADQNTRVITQATTNTAIPPFSTPLTSHAQPAVTSALERIAPGSQSGRASGAYTRPAVSCSRNRAIRVPASIVVRMNSPSNMIAKWYQYFSSHSAVTQTDRNASSNTT